MVVEIICAIKTLLPVLLLLRCIHQQTQTQGNELFLPVFWFERLVGFLAALFCRSLGGIGIHSVIDVGTYTHGSQSSVSPPVWLLLYAKQRDEHAVGSNFLQFIFYRWGLILLRIFWL